MIDVCFLILFFSHGIDSLSFSPFNIDSAEILYLDDNQLSGPIPSEIGLLTSLTDLNLYFNQLSGPIPSEIQDLSQLGKYVWTFDRQFAFGSL